MPAASSSALPGLLLPPAVIQPFFLRYRRDDLHLMAVLDGHPGYEAVEAMIAARPGGRHAIRAIITRHDQSQVDHINDDALGDEMRGADRAVHRAAIDFTLDNSGPAERARLSFISMADEEVVLDLTTLGPPDPSRAGLTDPGGHSLDRSLPLMWRGASTLAGPATHVTIDGVRHETPRFAGAATLDARQGYFTQRHSMGVVRAGTLAMKVLAAPVHLLSGAEWVFEIEGREVRCDAVDDGEGGLNIEAPDGSTVTARAYGERLAVARISVPAQDDPAVCMILTFDAEGSFRVAMEGQESLLMGRATTIDTADGAVLVLDPTAPNWAAARAVRAACARNGDRLTLVTTICG